MKDTGGQRGMDRAQHTNLVSGHRSGSKQHQPQNFSAPRSALPLKQELRSDA